MKGLAICATSCRGKAPLHKGGMCSANLHGTNMQPADPYHAQSLGRARQAQGLSQICTDQFYKEETLFGSQLKVVMTSQVIPVLIFPEVISSFIQLADENLMFFF